MVKAGFYFRGVYIIRRNGYNYLKKEVTVWILSKSEGILPGREKDWG